MMNWCAGAVVAKIILSLFVTCGVAHGTETWNTTQSATNEKVVADQRASGSNRRAKTGNASGPRVFAETVGASVEQKQTMPGYSVEHKMTDGGIELLVRRAVVASGLAGVLCIVIFIAIGKRSGFAKGTGSPESLELLATLALAPRCCVSLIRAQDQTILVARDSSGVKQMVLLQSGFEAYLDKDEVDFSPSLTQLQHH